MLPPTDENNAAAVEALDRFTVAAARLAVVWTPALDAGYPDGLPSFDELVLQLHAWRHAVMYDHQRRKDAADRREARWSNLFRP